MFCCPLVAEQWLGRVVPGLDHQELLSLNEVSNLLVGWVEQSEDHRQINGVLWAVWRDLVDGPADGGDDVGVIGGQGKIRE